MKQQYLICNADRHTRTSVTITEIRQRMDIWNKLMWWWFTGKSWIKKWYKEK